VQEAELEPAMTTDSRGESAPTAFGIEERREWPRDDPLEPPEQALLDHARSGMRLDLVGNGRVDHRAMDEWGPARIVRATVLRHLLAESQWQVHSKGVRLRGARISGPLDLESTALHGPLLLEDCYIDSSDPVVLDYATAPQIVLSRCRIVGGLTAYLLITKELNLRESVFEGVIRLSGADIAGRLICAGALLTGKNRDGSALVADGMKVGRDAYFDQVTAAGAVRLVGADISGQLSCRGSQLTGTDPDGDALVGDGMKVGRDAFFDQATAAGAVRLVGADITSQLACRGAQFMGNDDNDNALLADGMKVGGDALLSQGFTAAGAVSVAGARIDGSMTLDKAKLSNRVALKAAGVHVGGTLHWAPSLPVRGQVDLQRAAVHRLDDDWSLPDAHWPPAKRLHLIGFTYDGFGGRHQASWQQRLDWIRRGHTTATSNKPAAFATQPYEQLARVYRQSGQETEARQVAIARRNDLRRFGSLTRLRSLGNWLLDKTIRHGYQPLRAVGLLIVVYVVVLLVFWGAQHRETAIVPAKDVKNTAPTALHCSPNYTCFYPAGYAVDLVVPIINLRQAENWRPNGHAAWGWAYITVGWIATGLGWALTTLAVAGYTGLIRKE
jgi:hypothetical protein